MIELTNSEQTALVDDRNFDYLNQWDWRLSDIGYVVRYPSMGKTIYMHREVLHRAGYTNFEAGDHRNRNPLDNQETNLRQATFSQNQQNRGLFRNNTSGYIGLSWHIREGGWRIHITLGGRRSCFGPFDDLLVAVKARDVAALYFHDPEFVVLNFKRSNYPDGHPNTWPPGPFSDIIHRCRLAQHTTCNGLTGYWNVSWHQQIEQWYTKIMIGKKRIYFGCFEHLLDAVKVADTAAIHLGRDKINLGRTHYPPGNPRDWPEDAIPDCPALRRLINEDPTS